MISRKIEVYQTADSVKEGIRIVDEQIPPLLPSQVLIKNRFVGINGLFDRAVIRDELPYRLLSPPFDLGVEAIGQVIEIGQSVNSFSVGDFVSTTRFTQSYKEYQVEVASKVWKIPNLNPDYVALRPTAVSVLVALEQVGQIKDGETVAITAAAGGLGQFVVQFAKMRGCRVISICGGSAKVAFLNELGCDAVIDYKAGNVADKLKALAPKGVDLVYDTVGGQLFDVLVENLAIRGRLVVSGYASDMGKIGLPEAVNRPRIYEQIYWKAAQIRCFQNALYSEFQDEASNRILDWYESGKLKVKLEHRQFKGIEAIFDAIDYQLSGQSIGKVVVAL
jgi:NADPH-dependent curcumin reductase CurA